VREVLALAMMVGAARVRNFVTETLEEVGLTARGGEVAAGQKGAPGA